jgi:hypothetical protein
MRVVQLFFAREGEMTRLPFPVGRVRLDSAIEPIVS